MYLILHLYFSLCSYVVDWPDFSLFQVAMQVCHLTSHGKYIVFTLLLLVLSALVMSGPYLFSPFYYTRASSSSQSQSVWVWRSAEDTWKLTPAVSGNPYIYKYENVCLFVCVFVCVFLGHFECDWDTLWHKVAFWLRKGFKTIIFQKKNSQSYSPFQYFFKISL